jgi:hypothetical protein
MREMRPPVRLKPDTTESMPEVRLKPDTTYSMSNRYKTFVLEELWRHGVQPRATTNPDLVHGFVSDLYRYELRRLRDRLRRGEIPKDGYSAKVVELRRRYPLVSLKAREWVE